MLLQTRAPEIAEPPTYGGLLDDVRRTLEVAAEAAVDPADPYPHINGHERFLRAAGANLAALGVLTGERPEGLGTLQARLLRLPHRDAGATAWDKAATRLGAAHDLLATHLEPQHQIRTPEAADILEHSGALPAIRDVTDLTLVAATAGHDLVRMAATHSSKIPLEGHSRHFLVQLNQGVLLYAKAVLWDLETQLHHTRATQIADLRPALLLRPAAAPALSSPLQALRLLRQSTHSQAHGQANASAESLRDLARLGARVTAEIRDHLPQPETSRGRVEQAHLHDSLDQAHTAWQEAEGALGPHVQAVTKASAAHGTAITHLLRANDLTLPTYTAILTALPRLGTDSATAIQRLTRTRLLAIASRDPGRLSATWRPLHEHEGDALARRFATAATTTRDVADQVRRLTAPTACPTDAPAPLPHRTREQHRQVTHP